jgi:hypothetical protein
MSLANINAYAAEIGRRGLRYSAPVVLTLERGASNQAAEGFIFIAVANEGSQPISEIIRAVKAGNHAQFAAFADRANQLETLRTTGGAKTAEFPETVWGPLRKLAQKLREQDSESIRADTLAVVPVFGEIRYGTRTLTSSLFAIPLMQTTSVRLPYNGGKLDFKAFRFVEYFTNESDPALQAVVVIAEPTLSALEKQILEKVPMEKSEVHIGVEEQIRSGLVEDVVDYVKGVVDQAWHDMFGPPPPPTATEMTESLQMLAKLPPDVAARRLVALRAQALVSGEGNRG